MIFGKRLSDYVAFCKPFLILIPLVGIIRLALSLGGVSPSLVRFFTMTGLVWIGVIYYSIRVHTTGFGSYKQLLVICALQNWAGQAVAIFAIALSIFTGTANIFSMPEYAFGSDGRTWTHLAAHLFIGTTIGSLVPWGIGSLILLITKKLTGKASQPHSVRV